MADEATLVLKVDGPIDFIVSNLVGIEKGTIMEMSTPRTAYAISNSGGVFAGIARREKIASDGRTRLALFRRGIFRMKSADGSVIPTGKWVSNSTINTIKIATEAEIASGAGIGIALEDFTTSSEGEVFVGGY